MQVKQSRGFSLIELIMVVVILGALAVIAAPRFLNLSSDARVRVIDQINVSVKTANDLVQMKKELPSYSTQVVNNRDDLLDIDLDGDGTFETRLKWGYLDNTDIEHRLELSEEFVLEEQGIANTFIGYDFDNDGDVTDDQCYFHYTQASNADTPPQYANQIDNC